MSNKDKKVFHSIIRKDITFKPRSKKFKEEFKRTERQELLKGLLYKRSRRLNNKERIELINLLSKKDNLTFSTLDTIIEMKEVCKIKNVEINNAKRELGELDNKRQELLQTIDRGYEIIEKSSNRLNKFLTKY